MALSLDKSSTHFSLALLIIKMLHVTHKEKRFYSSILITLNNKSKSNIYSNIQMPIKRKIVQCTVINIIHAYCIIITRPVIVHCYNASIYARTLIML